MPLPEPLNRIFEVYCESNVLAIKPLAEHYKRPDWSYSKPELFKEQLRTVILNRSISIVEYEELTHAEFDSLDELYEWLTYIWEQVVNEPLKRLK
jgi:hypothetical protein